MLAVAKIATITGLAAEVGALVMMDGLVPTAKKTHQRCFNAQMGTGLICRKNATEAFCFCMPRTGTAATTATKLDVIAWQTVIVCRPLTESALYAHRKPVLVKILAVAKIATITGICGFASALVRVDGLVTTAKQNPRAGILREWRPIAGMRNTKVGITDVMG